MKGVFIPLEFYKIKELSRSEREVLGVYKYFTEEGAYKCCSLSNQEIGEMIDMSRRNVIDIKNHLKELGFIEVCPGKKVVYLGIDNYTKGEAQLTPKGEIDCTPKVQCGSPLEDTKGAVWLTPECSVAHPKGEAQLTLKVQCGSLINVKKEKEEKKEIKREMTNFERILGLLPEDYKKPDMIEFLYESKKDWIEKINESTDIDYKGLTTPVKQILLGKFYSEINKPINKPIENKEEKNWWDEF